MKKLFMKVLLVLFLVVFVFVVKGVFVNVEIYVYDGKSFYYNDCVFSGFIKKFLNLVNVNN